MLRLVHRKRRRPASKTGFEEISHTADCAMRVWGQDLESLFVTAARGMSSLAGARLNAVSRVTRRLSLHSTDAESLLVQFLSELVFLQENESLGFDKFRLQVTDRELSGMLEGSELLALTKPIKAVTFHNLNIVRTQRGLEAEIVFDV